MANTLWPRGRSDFLDGSQNWSTDTHRIGLLRGYTYNSSHQFVSDVTAGGANIVGTSVLASKGVGSVGNASAADGNFGTVAAGAAISHVVIYKDTGSSATSRLLLFIDTATGLPVTPNGSTISYTFNASGVFQLT